MTKRQPTKSEQKLVDIAIQLAIMCQQRMKNATIEEVALYCTDQLNKCGYETIPIGMSWAVLKSVNER